MTEPGIAPGLLPLAVPIDRLEPDPRNPRRGDVEAVQRSYARFGQRKPIVARRTGGTVRAPRGVVTAGNHQLRAATALGWRKIAVVWVAETEEEARAYGLADNRTSDVATYDDRELADLLQALDEETLWDAGYSPDDLEDLLASLQPEPVGLTDPDDVPEPPADPVTKPGDLWLLGEHRLLCGDSSDPAALDRLYSEKVGCVLTDPPYGIDLDTDYSKNTPRADAKKGRKYKSVIGDDQAFDASSWAATFASVAEQFWFGANYYRRTLPGSDLEGSWLVWDKRDEDADDPGSHWDDAIGSAFELCWSRTRHGHRILRYRWTNWTSHTNAGLRRAHPTEKPVALLADILNRYAPLACVVADPFAGSGTTLIAAEQTDRTAYLMEIDPAYCDVIVARWEAFTGHSAELDALSTLG